MAVIDPYPYDPLPVPLTPLAATPDPWSDPYFEEPPAEVAEVINPVPRTSLFVPTPRLPMNWQWLMDVVTFNYDLTLPTTSVNFEWRWDMVAQLGPSVVSLPFERWEMDALELGGIVDFEWQWEMAVEVTQISQSFDWEWEMAAAEVAQLTMPFNEPWYMDVAMFVDDPVVATWISNVIAAGGSVNSTTRTAMNNFVLGLKSDGLWTKMSQGWITPLATDGFAGLFVPLIIPAGRTVIPVDFVSGDYSLTTGLDCGSANASKRIDTDCLGQDLFLAANPQISTYINLSRSERNVTFTSNSLFNDSFERIVLAVNFLGITYWDTFVRSTGRITDSSPAPGLVSGVRSVPTDTRIFNNGVEKALGTGQGGDFPGLSTVTWFAAWNGTNYVATDYDKNRHCYLYAGPALTPAEEALHYARVQTLQTALGRNV